MTHSDSSSFLRSNMVLLFIIYWCCASSVFLLKKISDHQVEYINYINPNMFSCVVCILVGVGSGVYTPTAFASPPG